jgi:hypothetical protein
MARENLSRRNQAGNSVPSSWRNVDVRRVIRRGLCLIGDSYNDILLDQPVPFDTNREDPQGLNAGDISPNDGLTVLLVEGFTGVNQLDIDTDDDGVFDARPWERVIDGATLI